MKLEASSLQGTMILVPTVYGDERGFFMETWNEKVCKDLGLEVSFVQDNHSKSAQGILRGLHYQTEHTQGKLVRVISGEVFDVAVDLRQSSNTYGQWEGVYLSAENKRMFWVPPGFAHGFYVVSESAEFLYKCTDFYDPKSEISLRWDDPELAIDWPTNGKTPIFSEKDASGLSFSEAPKFC